MIVAAALCWAGFFVLLCRLWPLGRRDDAGTVSDVGPLVSIIVPARNEEKNLPALLISLKQLTYKNVQIIVVDDRSTDRTARMARDYGVEVIPGQPLPENWNGKNWACHQGALQAHGEYLIFTDADTIHRPDGVSRAVNFFQETGAALISALPYHRCDLAWEKMFAAFHALVFVATAPASPRPRRLFAIGQYLLFSRDSYARLGGHAAIAPLYPDDLALANRCIDEKLNYAVHTSSPLFDARMYATFGEFVRGWRRNFFAGLRQTKLSAVAEVTLAIVALAGAGRLFSSAVCLGAAAFSLAVVFARRRSFGNFPFFGTLLWPVPVSVYCVITLLAVWDLLRGNRLEWKGRSYENWSSQ